MKFKLPKYDGYTTTSYVAGRLEEYIPDDRIAEFNEEIEKEVLRKCKIARRLRRKTYRRRISEIV